MPFKITLPSILSTILGLIAGVLSGLLGSQLLDLFGLHVDLILAIGVAVIGTLVPTIEGSAFRNALHIPAKALPIIGAVILGLGTVATQVPDLWLQGVLEGVLTFLSWLGFGPAVGQVVDAVRSSGKPYRLGKLPYRHDDRTLLLAKYLDLSKLPTGDTDLTVGLKLPMYLNDTLGDCAIAGPGHMIGAWTWAAKKVEKLLTKAAILKAYSAVSGYDPKTGANDNGCVLLDVLKYWRTTGIGGHKIAGFVKVDHTNIAELRAAHYLFGGVLWGFALPEYIEPSESNVPAWTTPNGPLTDERAVGSLGGHCVDGLKLVQRTSGGYVAQVGSWGQLIDYDVPGFTNPYADEAWGVLSLDWLETTGKTIDGFDVAQLTADLAAL